MPDARTSSVRGLVRRPDALTRHQHENLAAIAETVKQLWPRCSDERIDPAAAWAPYFTDLDVVAWLEAGVYTAAAAIRLGRAGVGPRQVARQYEVDVTLGLAFTHGEMSVEQLLREVAR